MSLKDDLTARTSSFALDQWGSVPDGRVVPTAESLTFNNTGIRINACVLYADIHKSTAMVQALPDYRAAEYYKAFLYCAAKIIRSNLGTITAYDGDRIMSIFMGSGKCDQAIKSAFEINWAVHNIINPIFNAVYAKEYILQHTVGIDTGKLLASKTGVRVDNDIVWVGDAANIASKLNSFDGLAISHATRITSRVWEEADISWCFNGDRPMWEQEEHVSGITYRRSNWWRSLA